MAALQHMAAAMGVATKSFVFCTKNVCLPFFVRQFSVRLSLSYIPFLTCAMCFLPPLTNYYKAPEVGVHP